MDTNNETIQENSKIKASDKITEKIKEILGKVSDFIRNWKYLIRIIWWIAIATTVFMTFFITKTIMDTKKLD